MKLKSIEINGFKSFADKIKLDFETNITAIIGPNGSGKSNVADAVRWVLGEQSVKSLRGSKMEDVIFSGTDEKTMKNFAVVTITFDNSDNIIPIEFKEVSVSRKLYRSGESEYFINKSQVRLKEVKELFLDTGIGREGYSIIGQGRIEEIINGKSEDRRMIFEEASGISKIKYKKNESQKKLIRTKENLARLRDIILQNEQRYEFLKIQSDKAKKGMDLVSKIEKADFSISYRDYNNHKINVEKYKSMLSQSKEEYSKVSFELEKIKNEIEPVKKELFDLNSYLDTANNEYTKSINEKNEISNKKEILIERNIYIKNSTEQSIKYNDEYNLELSLINKKLSGIDSDILKKEEGLINFKKVKNDFKLKLDENRNILETEISKLKALKDSKLEMDNRINVLETEKKAEDIVKQNIEKKINENFKEIKNLENSKLKVENSIENLNKQLQSKLEEKECTYIDTVNLGKSIDHNDEKLKSLNDRNNNISNEIIYHNKEISMLNNYIKNYEGYNKSVQELFKLLERNLSLKNMVCGTLGDIISVDEKYKKAVDTVLSSNLQGIVVHNESEAKVIIEKIKENKIGRLNFFPISKIFSKNEKFNVNDKNILSFANMAVECDKEYRNIVDYFLSKTIICKDLEVALELSKKYKSKFKIVTLDGDIISTWGSISGGYKSNKHSFSLIGRKKQLQDALSKVLNLEKELENNDKSVKIINEENLYLKKSLAIKNDKSNLLNTDIENIQKNIYKLNLDLENLVSKINDIKDYEENHSGFTPEKERELSNLIENRDSIDIEISYVKEIIEKLKNEISNLEKEEIFAINNLDTVQRDVNILLNEKSNLLENRLNIENKLNLKTKEISDLKSQFSDNLLEIKLLEEQIKVFEELLTNLSMKIDENTALKRNISEKNEKLSSKLMNLSQEFYNLEKEIEKNDLKLTSSNSQLFNIISRLCDDYSISDEVCDSKMNQFKDEKFTKEELKKLKEMLRDIGSFSYDSIEEFEKVRKELEFQKLQELDLKNSIEDITKIIIKLENTMKKNFIEEFKNINERFSNIFRILFNGGEARLELDSDDILTCGIDIIAKPLGKKMQTLSLLSGGEKSLTAVALLFAIFETKPSPFCILDEVDAALDDSNILRYVEYLKTFLKDIQFIMITHRKPTMEMAEMIYGVTMEKKGISKIVSMKFNGEE